MGKAVFSFREGFRLLGLLVAACPAGATAQPLAAGCLLAAMPLRDSSCPVGAVPPRMGRVPCGENLFFFCGEAECFLSCSWFLPARMGCTSCGKTTFSFACPAGAKTTFSFAPQKKKRFWTPKKKRWTSGNDYGLRYNRIKSQPCLVIPRVKDFRVSLLFPAACV